MSWETRRNGRRYYYTATRAGGRVVKRYLGAGEFAEALAALDGMDAQRRRVEREAERSARVVAIEQDRAAVEAFEAIETLARVALLSAGYRRHHRGEWRKQRRATKETGTEGPRG